MAPPREVKQKGQGRPANSAEKKSSRIGAHQRSCAHPPPKWFRRDESWLIRSASVSKQCESKPHPRMPGTCGHV